MKKLLAVLLLFTAFSTQAAEAESAYDRVLRTGVLRCGYALWPMWTEKDPNTGQMSGIVFDVANALGAKLGLKIEWTEEIIVGQQPEALKRGNIDAICTADAAWIYTQAARVDYTRPFAYSGINLYVRTDDNRFTKLKDLDRADVIISAMDGDLSSTLAQEKLPHAKLLSLPQTADASQLMLNVIDGKADGLLIDPAGAKTIEKSHPGALKQLGDTVAVFSLSFTTSLDEPKLNEALSQGFDLLQAMGTLDSILEKYDPNHTDILRINSSWKK